MLLFVSGFGLLDLCSYAFFCCLIVILGFYVLKFEELLEEMKMQEGEDEEDIKLEKKLK